MAFDCFGLFFIEYCLTKGASFEPSASFLSSMKQDFLVFSAVITAPHSKTDVPSSIKNPVEKREYK